MADIAIMVATDQQAYDIGVFGFKHLIGKVYLFRRPVKVAM